MTWKQFIDDVMVSLGMVTDDSLWTRDNILQNTLNALHKLNVQELSADTGPGASGVAGAHAESWSVVSITHNTPSDTEWANAWFILPSAVYDIPFDKGIRGIRYHRPSLPVNCAPSVARATFTPTTVGSLSMIWGAEYQKPKEDRPYFTRVKENNEDRVYLWGISPLITKVLVGIYAAPNFISVDYNDELPINDGKLFTLKNMVMQSSVWPLQLPQERLKNDGRDLEPGQTVNTSPAIGVNNPAILENPNQ